MLTDECAFLHVRLLPVPDTAGDARGSVVKRVAVVAMDDKGGREDEKEVEDWCEVCVREEDDAVCPGLLADVVGE